MPSDKVRILIVDRDPEVGRRVRDDLSGTGSEIDQVAPALAEHQLTASHYDLVLMDVQFTGSTPPSQVPKLAGNGSTAPPTVLTLFRRLGLGIPIWRLGANCLVLADSARQPFLHLLERRLRQQSSNG